MIKNIIAIIIILSICILMIYCFINLDSLEVKLQDIQKVQENLDYRIQKAAENMIMTYIMDRCLYYEVPIDLAMKICYTESANENVVSRKNKDGSRDHGRFQLNDKYHDVIGKTDFQLIDMAIKEMRRLYSIYEDWWLVTFYYHAGTKNNIDNDLKYLRRVFEK